MDNHNIELTPDELEKLAHYLQKSIGIHLDSAKLKRFQRKIESIFTTRNIQDFSTFYHRLRFQNDEQLKQELMNAVTVNETYFWREHEQFEILAEDIIPKFIKTEKLNTIRILVAPTSSGEELYSIMLAILDRGTLIEKLNIELVGIDIDSKMIQKAKAGLYTQRSVEKLPDHLRKSYFTKLANLYKIDEHLRSSANFMQANIFDEQFIKKMGQFDIIFSRNMLIYFNDSDKQKCYTIFYDALKPKGFLFLGHADANNINKKIFTPYKKGFHIYIKNSALK